MKKALPFIILALVLVVGVAGYFIYKHFEKKEAEKNGTMPTAETNSPGNETYMPQGGGLLPNPEIFVRKPLWIEPKTMTTSTAPVVIAKAETIPINSLNKNRAATILNFNRI